MTADPARQALEEILGTARNPAKPRNALDGIISIAEAALAHVRELTQEHDDEREAHEATAERLAYELARVRELEAALRIRFETEPKR